MLNLVCCVRVTYGTGVHRRFMLRGVVVLKVPEAIDELKIETEAFEVNHNKIEYKIELAII